MGRFLQSQAALAVAAGVSDCTVEKLEEARQQVAEDVEGPEKEQDQEGYSGQEGCVATGTEFQQFWDDSIYPELVNNSRNCSSGDVSAYRNCLNDQMVRGELCFEEAFIACEADYKAIPNNITGSISLDINHSEAENVQGLILISSETDSVSGSINYILKDMHVCTINISGSFQGTYDRASCSISGNGELTYIYEGAACASVCGSGPNSETACPVTISGGATWEASVEGDTITGGIGCDDENSPGCVGFRGGY